MRIGSWVVVALAALAASPARAQVDVSPDSVIRTAERAVFGKETGHDKCKGQGHQNSGGDGHEDGECEQQEPAGPVSETACADTVDGSESAWRRYACTVSAYNEDYVARTIESNQEYPATLADYALNTDERVVAAGDVLVAGVNEALPLLGGPTPGPTVTEAAEALTTYSRDYIDGADERVAAGSDVLLAGVAEALPLLGGPTPGPTVTEIRTYVELADERLVAGTTVLVGGVNEALPLLGGPTPGPTVTEAAEALTGYATDYVAGADERFDSGTAVLVGGVNEALPLLGGPTPGPTVHEYIPSTMLPGGG